MAAMPVQAVCWTDSAAEATQVRMLQTRLMVATLKCQTAGIDITAPYNDFVRAKRDVLAGVNTRIKAHFAAEAAGAGADAAGQAEYDRFVTSLANAFGADKTSADTCAAAAALAIDAAGGNTDLLHLAAAQDEATIPAVARRLGGGLCEAKAPAVQLAAAAPPSTPVAVIPAATASAPATRPPLPPEVVAAMAVIAAFARDQGAPSAGAAAPDTPAPIATAMIGTP